jgi:hypothetical protein
MGKCVLVYFPLVLRIFITVHRCNYEQGADRHMLKLGMSQYFQSVPYPLTDD